MGAVVVCARSTARVLGFPFLDLVLIDHRGLNEQHIARVGGYLTFDRFEVPQACAVASSKERIADAHCALEHENLDAVRC